MSIRFPTKRQRGFSLIELMIAVTISIIMFAVIIELFASNKEAYRLQGGASVLNENARFAISHLQYYMRLADHWGGVEPLNVTAHPTAALPVTVPPCGGDALVFSNIGFRGYDAAEAATIDCISAATNYQPNTDAFFIRYGASHEDGRASADVPGLNGVPIMPDAHPPAPAVAQIPVTSAYVLSADGAGVWIRTVLGRRAVFFDNDDLDSLPEDIYSAPPDDNPLAAANYRFQAMLYYIRPCAEPRASGDAALCDGTDDGIPTLVRRILNPDMTFNEQEIVAGVENMQLLYGVDQNDDFVADIYQNATAVQAAGDWANVVSARVSLMVANLERDNTVNDTGTYVMLDSNWTVPAGANSFRRTQYEFTVQIRNMTRA